MSAPCQVVSSRSGRSGPLDVVDRLRDRHGIDALMLAGAELPLLLRGLTRARIAVHDEDQIPIEAAIDELLRTRLQLREKLAEQAE